LRRILLGYLFLGNAVVEQEPRDDEPEIAGSEPRLDLTHAR
jgi:hypothetical protein